MPVAAGFCTALELRMVLYFSKSGAKKQNNMQQTQVAHTKAKMFPFLAFYRSFGWCPLKFQEPRNCYFVWVNKIP